MALIEHLERDNWQQVFRNSFQYALEVLKTDRFRPVGSSVDDLKSWLAVGGVDRVRCHLKNQMEMCGLTADRKAEVNDCLEQLIQENQNTLLELMAAGIVPVTNQEWPSNPTHNNDQVDDYG